MLMHLDDVDLENANGFICMCDLAVEVAPDGDGELEIRALYLVQKLFGAEKLIEFERDRPNDFLGLCNAAYEAVESRWDSITEDYAAFDPAWSAEQYSRMVEDRHTPIRL